MGTAFVANQYAKSDKKSLIPKVASDISQAAYEDGHSYSGNWGEMNSADLRFIDKTFSDEEKACEWLSDNADKRGPLLAVKVLQPVKASVTASIDKKIHAERIKHSDLNVEAGGGNYGYRTGKAVPQMNSILLRVKDSKSKFKGCEYCGSKVSIAHISQFSCPVCSNKDFLLTDTDKKRFERLESKIAKSKEILKSLQEQREAKFQSALNPDKWNWIVGGNCSS
jgi:hypothetical protein